MERGMLEFGVEVLYSDKDIQKYVRVLANHIKSGMRFEGKIKNILYACVMNGAVQFFHDITKQLPSGYCHYMTASSYKDNERSGNVEIHMPSTPKMYEQIDDIYIFDDICDTGNTLDAVVRAYHRNYPSATIHTAVLIHRLRNDAIYRPNFAAIKTESDVYFAGYGLDNKGLDRNLPYIYSVPKEGM